MNDSGGERPCTPSQTTYETERSFSVLEQRPQRSTRSASKTIRVLCMVGIGLTTGILAPHAMAQVSGDEQPEIEPVMDWGTAPSRPTQASNQNTQPETRSEKTEPTVSFGAFSEPIELNTLIEYVGSALNINIVVKGSPSGEVNFSAPVSVPKSKLIDLLDSMLEQYSFTISRDPTSDFWIVQPIADLRPLLGYSTQIISTPNIKPSLILPALTASLGSKSSGGAPNQAGGPIQAIDELGVLIINAPARDIERIKALVTELLRIDDDQQYIRFELDHLAAPAALERAVGLVGGNSTGRQQLSPNQGGQVSLGLSAASLSNMADRITVDPQGNALIFKGTTLEISRVQEVLDVIDVPNTLEPKNYFAGSSAGQIADIARSRGLGEVISIDDESNNPFAQANIRINNQGGLQGQQSSSSTGGPVMVVDTTQGNIIYYGTPAQQQQLADLLKELDTDDERVIIKEYVLNHSDAEVVAELMTAIITGEQQTGSSEFLQTASGRRNTQTDTGQFFNNAGGSGSDVAAAFDPNVVGVFADPDNNQVVVRAPIKQQDDLAKLINRLDRRKPQVFLQAMIVSVSDTENFTLAFESQINAGQFGVNTGSTLSGLPDASTFGDLRSVNPGLGGLTAAVIMTNQIPIIINASQTNSDVRILSTPQLLVNDNQESEIVALSEQPFQEISQGDGGNVTAFAGFAEAGTTLRVTPSISDGGFLRLDYFVELSNFTAAAGTDGSPPPRDRNTVQGTATIPSDATIVIGGITVDNVRDTVIKVPLLGDIPLIGELFKNTTKVNTQSKLYVFLTPRIMTDPNFIDLKLMSEGPYSDMDLDPRVPELESMSINASTNTRSDDPFAMPRDGLPAEPTRDPMTPDLSPVLVDPYQIESNGDTD
ncbi:MAG: secretin N-terminal domain-containing protein [Phycisphaerales bacterium]